MTKNIVITGCTRGLGRALAKHLTQEGHRVWGCGRQEPLLQSLENELGTQGRFSRVDVTDMNAVNVWAQSILAEDITPDYVINNAALINENKPFWEISAQDFDRIIDVNLKGVANVARAFLPAMIEAGKGILINLSSGYGHCTDKGVAPYCCTKFGVEGLTQAIAQDLPSSVAAIPMSPGIINTEMLQTTFGKENACHYPTAEEWVRTAVPYILSLNETHNGQSLRVPQEL